MNDDTANTSYKLANIDPTDEDVYNYYTRVKTNFSIKEAKDELSSLQYRMKIIRKKSLNDLRAYYFIARINESPVYALQLQPILKFTNFENKEFYISDGVFAISPTLNLKLRIKNLKQLIAEKSNSKTEKSND